MNDSQSPRDAATMDFSRAADGSSGSCLPHDKLEKARDQQLIVREETADSYGPSELLLSRSTVIAYGTGHMLNDLTAACWFTYLLIFLTDVGLSPKQAGVVMLVGQVADGIGTVCIGQLIDKFGKFKLWHGAGSLLVAASFSSVFGGCWTCTLLGARSTEALIYGYSTFAAVFNLGWAATQVSHMSLVNCVTANGTSRVALNSCRNAFTMLANLFLYGIALAVFEAIPSSTVTGVHRQYQWIVGLAILTGCLFILVFQLGVGEPRLVHHEGLSISNSKISAVSWFGKLLYYQVALVYLLTRLTTNVSQALLPFYTVDDLMLAQSAKAVVPAIIYVCSLVCSILMQELNWSSVKLKAFFTCGAALWIFSGATLLFIPPGYNFIVYLVSIVIGAANASMLVTATSMQGVLVGRNLSGCAFVYGSLSFLEKLACGLALYTIEGFHGDSRRCTGSKESFICSKSVVRLVLATLPGSCACAAALVAVWMHLDEDNAEELLHEPLLAPGSSHSAANSDADSVDIITMPLNDGPDVSGQAVSLFKTYGVRGRAHVLDTTAGGHKDLPAVADDTIKCSAESSTTLASVALWRGLSKTMAAFVRAPYDSILHHEHKP